MALSGFLDSQLIGFSFFSGDLSAPPDEKKDEVTYQIIFGKAEKFERQFLKASPSITPLSKEKAWFLD
jgi:hypothetical protein